MFLITSIFFKILPGLLVAGGSVEVFCAAFIMVSLMEKSVGKLTSRLNRDAPVAKEKSAQQKKRYDISECDFIAARGLRLDCETTLFGGA
jgi:hypothetical protein